jgi:hypothetical protein
VSSLDEQVFPGVQRDRQAVIDHWRAYDGWLEELSRSVNDQYLKANQVHGGVLAYGRAGRLIAAYLQSEVGRARFGDAMMVARREAQVRLSVLERTNNESPCEEDGDASVACGVDPASTDPAQSVDVDTPDVGDEGTSVGTDAPDVPAEGSRAEPAQAAPMAEDRIER